MSGTRKKLIYRSDDTKDFVKTILLLQAFLVNQKVLASVQKAPCSENVRVFSLFDKGVDMNTARRHTPRLVQEKLTQELSRL